MLNIKTVYVLYKCYKLVWCGNANTVKPGSDSKHMGFIDGIKSEIRLYDGAGIDKASQFATLLHEIIHGICFEMQGPLIKDKNHTHLDRLANVLADVLLRSGIVKL